MLRITLPAALYIALYTACSSANPLPLPTEFTLAPLYTPPSNVATAAIANDAHIVADSYIIVLKDHLEAHHIEAHHKQVEALHANDFKLQTLLASSSGSNVNAIPVQEFEGIAHKYHVGKNSGKKVKGFKGYSGKFSSSTVDAIRSLKDVKYVERDSIVWASEVEKGAPWGLARISHRAQLGFGTFNKYEYDGNGGAGVDVYVIDTGVNIEHLELEGRAKWGITVPKDPDADLNGHGSHVAGTIASKKYGVAKQANIIAVKVLGAGGSGTMADVVQGVAWAADASSEAARLKALGKNPKHKGSAANMSLGGGKSLALDEAVDAAVDDGLHFAVAAGNDNKDACAYSPAASVNAITVGASTIGDERAYFSNHGKCVDLFAPGLNILSIWNTRNTSTNTISGTSMASPHVAGLAAYFLSLYPESFDIASADFIDSAYSPFEISNKEDMTFFQQSAQMVLGQLKQWTAAGIVYEKLQHWTGRDETLAPIPYKPLSPKALKNAMVKLCTKDALVAADMPLGTPNLLIFNNYTTSAIVEAFRQE